MGFVILQSGKPSNWETSEAEEYYSPQEELDFMSASDQENNDEYDVQTPLNGDGDMGAASDTGNNKAHLAVPEISQVGDSLLELPEGRHRYLICPHSLPRLFFSKEIYTF